MNFYSGGVAKNSRVYSLTNLSSLSISSAYHLYDCELNTEPPTVSVPSFVKQGINNASFMESLRRIRCNECIAHYDVSQPLENIKITWTAPYSSNPKVQMEKRQVLKGRVGKEVPREVPRGHQIQCEHMGDNMLRYYSHHYIRCNGSIFDSLPLGWRMRY